MVVEGIVETRYRALRFIGTIYKLFGIIVLVVTALAVLAACVGILVGGAAFRASAAQSGVPFLGGGGIVGGIIVAFFGLLYGGAVGVTLFAAGDLVSLLLALEENTRTTAALLRGQPAAAPQLPPLH